MPSLIGLGVALLIAGCAASPGPPSPSAPVATHPLTQGQINAIVAAAGPHKREWENLSAGPMKAIRTDAGHIAFCAFVYTGQKNLFGTMNRYFFSGTFPSADSTAVSMSRATSDGQGIALRRECESKGLGIH